MTRSSAVLFAIFALFMLSGCESVNALGEKLSGKKEVTSPPPQLVAAPDSVSAMLADAADRTASALETLAAVEQHRAPGIAAPSVQNASRSLQTPISVNWTGPVEALASALADRTGYRFAVLGEEPAIPVVISVNSTHTPAIEVLRDIGLQMGRRADLRVDSPRKAIEIHYSAPQHNSGTNYSLGTGL